jgi:quercetin dioxygenase-like cupin family protein
VRVLRVTLEPGAKTPVHEHPAGVVTFLTEAKLRITEVGEKPNETPRKAKEVLELEPTRHTAENIGNAAVELILVELKGGAGGTR